MIYSVKIKASAAKALAQVAKVHRERLVHAIDALAKDPLSGLPLKGGKTGLRRIRVGDWRVIYEVQRRALIVLVVRVGHRGEVYR